MGGDSFIPCNNRSRRIYPPMVDFSCDNSTANNNEVYRNISLFMCVWRRHSVWPRHWNFTRVVRVRNISRYAGVWLRVAAFNSFDTMPAGHTWAGTGQYHAMLHMQGGQKPYFSKWPYRRECWSYSEMVFAKVFRRFITLKIQMQLLRSI